MVTDPSSSDRCKQSTVLTELATVVKIVLLFNVCSYIARLLTTQKLPVCIPVNDQVMC